MLRYVQFLGFLVVLLLFATACSGPNYAGNPYDPDIPDGPDSNPSPDPTDDSSSGLPAPDGVTASFFEGEVLVEWDTVSNAESYKIYRTVYKTDGSSSSDEINTSSNSPYRDSSYSAEASVQSVQYAVKAVAGGASSALSSYSESLSEVVPGFRVSVLEFSDKIQISWSKMTGAEEYDLCRSTEENGSFEVLETFTSTGSDYLYNDDTANEDEAYYYRIIWSKGAYEYGHSTSPKMGFYSSSNGDSFESNNTIEKASLIQSSVTNEATMYWLSNEDKDIDWYKYEGIIDENFQVEILAFLKFDVIGLSIDIYNDQGELLNSETVDRIPFTTLSQTIPDSGSLYFKIYPISGSIEDPISTYSFSIGF